MRPFLAAMSIVIFGGLTITPALGAQAKRDTLGNLAVIYTYPNGDRTTDSIRVLQRPYVATVKQPLKTKPKTTKVTNIRGKAFGAFTADSLGQADSRDVVAAIRKSLGERESKYAIAVTRFFGRDSAYAEAVMGAMHIRYKLDRTNGVWVKRPAELLSIYNYGTRAGTRADTTRKP